MPPWSALARERAGQRLHTSHAEGFLCLGQGLHRLPPVLAEVVHQLIHQLLPCRGLLQLLLLLGLGVGRLPERRLARCAVLLLSGPFWRGLAAVRPRGLRRLWRLPLRVRLLGGGAERCLRDLHGHLEEPVEQRVDELRVPPRQARQAQLHEDLGPLLPQRALGPVGAGGVFPDLAGLQRTPPAGEPLGDGARAELRVRLLGTSQQWPRGLRHRREGLGLQGAAAGADAEPDSRLAVLRLAPLQDARSGCSDGCPEAPPSLLRAPPLRAGRWVPLGSLPLRLSEPSTAGVYWRHG
mmetsp:Transcript_1073/g.2918  ORF Transcript_1073/g.2918 Transcript_1073/m.2918 type:complete len:295 (-) Transcript_1073:94-978(-)